MAVTKMARGVEPTAGTLLNGRVRNAVHWPDADRIQFIRTDRWIGFTQAERALD